jgi:3-hydroxyacyl-[acyl-carrier-protein] dehydratase
LAQETALRFELIDRVVERQADALTGIKNVSAAEEYLADHFPGFPVLPGVMMLEALVQAARLFVAGPDGEWADGGAPGGTSRGISGGGDIAGGGPLVVTQVRNVRYGNMVRPGQALVVRVTLRKQEGDAYEFQGEGTVDGQVAVQGRFRLEPLSAA